MYVCTQRPGWLDRRSSKVYEQYTGSGCPDSHSNNDPATWVAGKTRICKCPVPAGRRLLQSRTSLPSISSLHHQVCNVWDRMICAENSLASWPSFTHQLLIRNYPWYGVLLLLGHLEAEIWSSSIFCAFLLSRLPECIHNQFISFHFQLCERGEYIVLKLPAN